MFFCGWKELFCIQFCVLSRLDKETGSPLLNLSIITSPACVSHSFLCISCSFLRGKGVLILCIFTAPILKLLFCEYCSFLLQSVMSYFYCLFLFSCSVSFIKFSFSVFLFVFIKLSMQVLILLWIVFAGCYSHEEFEEIFFMIIIIVLF